jgi:predicted alpha/beta hydrolase family esterase
MKKTQVLMIHGGMTFKKRADYLEYLKSEKISRIKDSIWSGEYLDKALGKGFDIIRPEMPLRYNANYEDWKIWFEKYIPFLEGNIILIGRSLGGIFLAKYLSENKFPKEILSTYIICPPFDNTSLDANLVGGFKLGKDLSLLEKNTKNLYLMFSEDDPVVHISHAEKYRKKLKDPKTKIIIYKSKNGHFRVPKFPEIVKLIKGDVSKK